MNTATAPPPSAAPETPTSAEDLGVGWHPDVPLETYLAIDAVSNSALRPLRSKSPAHYRYEQEEAERDATRQMDLGKAIHLALLEPEAFEGRYIVLGQCEGVKRGGDRCTNPGKVYRDGQSFCGVHDPAKGQPEDPRIHTLPQEDMDAVLGCRENILAHPKAGAFFRAPGDREITGLWQDEDTGLWCKIRLDVRLRDPWMLMDLKSTPDASRRFFRRHAVRMGYHRKMAWYRRGCRALGDEVEEVSILAAETTPPYEPACYLLDPGQLDRLEAEDDRHLRVLAMCRESGEWPGYGADFIPMHIPAWGFDSEETDDE